MAHGLMLGNGRARRMIGICGTAAAMVLSVAPSHAQRGTPVPATPPPATASTDPLERLNESIDALTRKVWPSVVQILVTSYGPREQRTSPGETAVVVGRQRA